MPSPHDEDWVKIQYRNLARSIFVSDSAPDSLSAWKKQWFYVYMDGADWDDCFKPNFSRAKDAPVRSLKLDVEEEAAIRYQTGDNLHHSSILISEASLQQHGLSDMGPTSIFFSLLFLIFVTCNWALTLFSCFTCGPCYSGEYLQEKGGPRFPGSCHGGAPCQAGQKGWRRPISRESPGLSQPTLSSCWRGPKSFHGPMGPSE